MNADPPLTSLLTPARVHVGLLAETKADVLTGVVRLAATSPAVRDAALLLADVEAREATLSTGVGDGIALPHARTAGVTETVAALVTLARPVDFDALDGAPVRLAILLATPEGNAGQHVRLLGRVSRILSQPGIRDRLLEAATPEDFCATLADAEAAL